MGRMHFLAPHRQRVPQEAVERAYVAGMEGVPWRCRCQWRGDRIVIQWPSNESGNFYIPWPVEGHGELMLSTASLMQRDEVYHLPLELARGTLSRLRNQAAQWETAGSAAPDRLARQLKQAMDCFIRAATSQSDPLAAADHAEQSIRLSLDAIEQLAADRFREEIERRRRDQPRLPTFLACELGSQRVDEKTASALLPAFNTAVAPLAWRELEPAEGQRRWEVLDREMQWCGDQGLSVCGGPLLRLDPNCLPDWVGQSDRDFDFVQSHAFAHAYDVARRYRGRVRLWHSSAGMNTPGSSPWTEEQRLRLAVTAVEAVHEADPETPILISFDQPWCEYLAREDTQLPPWDFADALARAELGVAYLGLEINFGYWPGGAPPRDLMEIGRRIDRWGQLGLPLVVLLAIPSMDADDPQAWRSAKPLLGDPGGCTPETQRATLQRLAPLLLAKPFVEGVIWSQLSDAQPHAFPHGGLLDSQGAPKPVVEALKTIRETHLL